MYKLGQDIITGTVTVPGSGERLATITAEALPGYALIGSANWARTYGKPTTLEFFSEDTLDGPAGTFVVPDNGEIYAGAYRVGRIFPTKGAKELRWMASKNSLAKNLLILDGEGNASVDPTTTSIHSFELATDDCLVEIDVAQWPTNQYSGFFLTLGGFQFNLYCQGNGKVSLTTIPNSIYPAETGVWKFRRRGSVFDLTTPSGAVATSDQSGNANIKSTDTIAWLYTRSSSAGLLKFGGIRISGVIK